MFAMRRSQIFLSPIRPGPPVGSVQHVIIKASAFRSRTRI